MQDEPRLLEMDDDEMDKRGEEGAREDNKPDYMREESPHNC
jgi:hypothetical protein